MPSVSASQAKLMAAVAHGWKKPGGGGPSVAVAEDFNRADKGHSRKSLPEHKGKRQANSLRRSM